VAERDRSQITDSTTLLSDPSDVIRALTRFGDVFDPRTGSILFLGGTRGFRTEPFHPGFLAGVEERAELARRLHRLGQRERLLLFLWYVEGDSASEIAERLGISRVHCYRLRNRALTALASPDAPALARRPYRSQPVREPHTR
jgi:hypothetical protein